jgi:hypothetical protein
MGELGRYGDLMRLGVIPSAPRLLLPVPGSRDEPAPPRSLTPFVVAMEDETLRVA